MKFNRIYVERGKFYRVKLPWSEVCMHMQVAGKEMLISVVGEYYAMAQIHEDNGQVFSAPVTLGEAGVYSEGERLYVYGEEASIASAALAA